MSGWDKWHHPNNLCCPTHLNLWIKNNWLSAHPIKRFMSHWDSLTGQSNPGSKLLGGVRRVNQKQNWFGLELHEKSKYWSAWTDKINWEENSYVKFTISKWVVTLWGDDHLLSAFLVLVLTVWNLLWSVFSKGIILQDGQKNILYDDSYILYPSTNAFGKHIKIEASLKKVWNLKIEFLLITCSSDWGMELSIATGAWYPGFFCPSRLVDESSSSSWNKNSHVQKLLYAVITHADMGSFKTI